MGTLYSLLQQIYDNTIRGYLPRKVKRHNGVKVKRQRLFDLSSPNPYEVALIEQVTTVVQPSDEVTVIGGGNGVSTVRGMWAGATKVTVYEPVVEQQRIIQDTLDRNGITENVSLEPVGVGPVENPYAGVVDTASIAPNKLASCDVLVLDCEGAEQDILKQMEIQARAIVVELHPNFGVDPVAVTENLVSQGYDIVDAGVEVPEKHVVVVTAIQQ